ncbi:YcnI family protein [Paenibacillus xerothermodurans]|uniref:DUF1775 domain-containing protein n=1 Tax=Paenibacillus xerothermodurans TaxID=1977292 RepID=A0A2W1N6D8_PAEXE|nr:YcnI family protein [Paenibacillus xerothermodurans]PZE19927.1 DUF1775 domain-containing protein [Paenibacillus xerothermodurans]
MKRIAYLVCFCLLLTFVGATTVSAHVTVLPKEAVQGSYEKFAVRVPTEKEIPTVKVEVRFPVEAVSISRFEPKPGWTYELTKDDAGKITGVVWTATGEGLSATEFGEFYMQGKVADTAAEIKWKAYQTYKDGSTVEWVGAEGSDKPASVTKVTPKPAGTALDSHGHSSAPAQAASAHPQSAEAGGGDSTPLFLSIAAVVLALVSVIISLSKRKLSR